MRCPACDHDKSAVFDSRARKSVIYRRRKCSACGVRWSTYELRAADINAMIRGVRDFRASVTAQLDDLNGIFGGITPLEKDSEQEH